MLSRLIDTPNVIAMRQEAMIYLFIYFILNNDFFGEMISLLNPIKEHLK